VLLTLFVGEIVIGIRIKIEQLLANGLIILSNGKDDGDVDMFFPLPGGSTNHEP
jgi:hypothetical protein